MFDVVVWFCRSSSFAFLISAYLINLMHHFLLHWVICFGVYLFVHTPVFFENYLIFLCFSICSSFGRQLGQNFGWAGSEPYVRSHITEPPCYMRSFFLYEILLCAGKIVSSSFPKNGTLIIHSVKCLCSIKNTVVNIRYFSDFKSSDYKPKQVFLILTFKRS